MDTTFNKDDTKVIKGLAILFMLMHHLWNPSDRTPFLEEYRLIKPFEGLTLNGPTWFLVLGRFGKICVPLFAFLAGYGLYKQYAAGRLSLAKKIKKLYLEYWKVFIIFIPIAFIFFKNQEEINYFSGSYRTFHINECIVNFLAIDTEKYNGEWWFVMGFIICCVLGCFYVHVIKTKNKYIDFAVIFLINFFVFRAVPMFIYTEPFKNIREGFVYNMFFKQTGITAFFTGIVWAKYKLLDRGKQSVQSMHPLVRVFVFLAGSLCFICLRTFNGFEYWDFLTTPFYITICLGFCSITTLIYRVFRFLGDHSENIWLTHSFYCFYFTPFVKLIYGSRNALIALAITLALSLATSFLMKGFYKVIGNRK